MKEYAKRIVTGAAILLTGVIAATDHYVTKLKQQSYENTDKQALWKEFEDRCEHDTSSHIRNLNNIVEDRGFSMDQWYCSQHSGKNIARRL
jgi:hypothetical protein